jgi:hypothetical protein
MVEDRRKIGPLISAAGAALLGVSVFLPWYGISITASGAASAQRALNNAAQEFGNAAFQAQAKTVGAGFGAYAGRQVTTLSAHQLLKDLSVLLLILAASALVMALLRLAATSAPTLASDSQIVVVGLVAIACVLFRMLDRPAPAEDVISLSLSWGVWLALGSSVAIVLGGLWPTHAVRETSSPGVAWDKLSGWTPEG